MLRVSEHLLTNVGLLRFAVQFSIFDC